MTADELRSKHEEYRRCIEVMRDEAASQEQRDNASNDVMRLRHELDEALIQDKEDREDQARLEAVEARARTQALLAQLQPEPVKRTGELPMEEIRSFVEKKEQGHLNLSIPYAEKRTEYDVSTAASNAYGSYLVPQTWASYVITAMEAQSGVLQAGPTIIRTAQGGQMNFPTLSTDVAGAAGTEGSDATQDTPVFGTVPLNSYRVDCLVKMTDELIRDANVDLAQYLGNLCGRALGQTMATYLGDEDIGTGSSAPAAITVGATSAVTAASQTIVTLDEYMQLYAAVSPVYRANGKWIVSSTQYANLIQAKDDNGQYIVHPNLSAAMPDTLLGKPLFEDVYFDASATGNKVVLFGDIAAAYMVRFVGNMDISFSKEAGWASFETWVRAGVWFDSATAIAAAAQIVTLA